MRTKNRKINVNVRVLYSDPWIPGIFKTSVQWMQPRPITLLCHACMRGSPPLPDQLPGEHTGLHHILCSMPSNNCLQCSHTYTHLFMIDRSMVVGHVPTVHTCSFMCTNHIDMIAHTSAFYKWEALPSSGLPSCKQRMAGILNIFWNFLLKPFSRWDLNLGPSSQQMSVLTIKPCCMIRTITSHMINGHSAYLLCVLLIVSWSMSRAHLATSAILIAVLLCKVQLTA